MYASSPFVVEFEPIGRRIEVAEGTNLLAASQDGGIQLTSLCGGVGSCLECRVRLVSGQVSPPSLLELDAIGQEDLSAGWRLACQTTVLDNTIVDIPPESLTAPQRLQLEGEEIASTSDPVVTSLDIQLSPPSLDDPRADSTRLRDALLGSGLKAPSIQWHVIQTLSPQLRALGWSARLAVRGEEVVAIMRPEAHLHGLALDIGTTKLAAYLVDLASGATIAKTGAMNPQISYGEDVVSRIVSANTGEKQRLALQSKLVATLNDMIAELCSESGVSHEEIVQVVAVGNTAMHHLFLGLPVQQLGASPYVPALGECAEVNAKEIGLQVGPGAYIYLPPNIAGYVGADHVAVILAARLYETEKTLLAIDIGTNTEISLARKGRMLSCSCASGPAFEGAHIRDGMRAAPGAIERLQIEPAPAVLGDRQFRVQTIGNLPPVGLCGSGIIDAVAELRAAGVLDASGRLQKQDPMVHLQDNRPAVMLIHAENTGHGRDILITQNDINEIQLAKGAIRTGIEVLLAQAGLAYDAIDEFIVAGAFGNYINIRSAIRLGMFPDLPAARFRQVGNAAGMGAKLLLISKQARETANQVARRIEYVELANHPDFQQVFLDALHLP
jgi:uncharacterized 2Fe-2S/4Fe-4S cluster protein (DUF4445 family)